MIMNESLSWFKNVATYTTWPQMPNAHGPFGKDKLTSQERDALRGIPMFLNVQTESAIREAHKLGGRALSYVSFKDTYVHTDGFENGTARVSWDARRPQILLVGKDGRFINTPMDGTWRMWRYQVCCNTKEYVEMALDMVHRQMQRGADGLFIDNSGPRSPCYGHGVGVGYDDHYRQVCAAIVDWENPELLEQMTPEELCCQGVKPSLPKLDYIENLPVHRHIYPRESHDYAYTKLLQKIYKTVKSYGRDKVIVLNGGHQFAGYTDALMFESYIYSWTHKGPSLSWLELKERAENRAPGFRENGIRALALSYLGKTLKSVTEDALFSFAAATLFGYVWSDHGTCKDKLGDALRKLKPGKRLTSLLSCGPVDYSVFSNSLIAINGEKRKRTVALELPRSFRHEKLLNLADNTEIARKENVVHITIPANSGRVLVKVR